MHYNNITYMKWQCGPQGWGYYFNATSAPDDMDKALEMKKEYEAKGYKDVTIITH